jgi:hypothetical protein
MAIGIAPARICPNMATCSVLVMKSQEGEQGALMQSTEIHETTRDVLRMEAGMH